MLMAWLVLMAVLGTLYLTVAVSPDQALFDYIAWSHLQGDYYYAGVAEQNWPGKMLIHELGIRIFGVHFWTFRAVDFLFLLLICAGGAVLLHQAGFTMAPIIFLFLYPTLYVTAGDWQAGQRDIIAAGVLISAAALTQRHGPYAVFAAGIFVALAVLIRPTYLSYLVGVLALEWVSFRGEVQISRAQTLGRSLAIIIGFVLPIALVTAGGYAIGALDDFYQQSFLFNIEVYQASESRSRLPAQMLGDVARDWHWVTVLAALGLALWLWRDGLTRTSVLIIGLIATVILSYFVQNKGFLYHIGGLLTAMALLISIAIQQLLNMSRERRSGARKGMVAGVLAIAVLLCVGGSLKKLSNYSENFRGLISGPLRPFHQAASQPGWDEIEAAVRVIRENSAPNDFVLQWGRNFLVPFLAQRRSSLRFISSPAAWLERPEFSLYEEWLAEVQHDMAVKTPQFAIVNHQVLAPGEAIAPHAGAGPVERLVIGALAEYSVVQRNPYFWVLKRP